MNSRNADSYVLLAITIGACAIIASFANTMQFIRDFDIEGSGLLVIVGGSFAQASMALAMLCAILVVQQWLSGDWRVERTSVLGPPDSADEPMPPPFISEP